MSAEPEIVTQFRRVLDETSEEDLQVMAYKSPALHFALYMEIKDKNANYIRPFPNVLQLRISQAIETLREYCAGTRIRLIVVKPRRAGCSTFSLHCGYHEAQRRPIEGITIADCGDNSKMLMERLADYSGHDSFPWDNPLTADNTSNKAWANGSSWVIDTAENPDAGVGGTRQFGHFSEVAKYPQTTVKNDVKTMTAALPSLDGDDTIGIAESTPEGAVGWMHGTFTEKAMWLEDFLARWEQGFRPEEVWIRIFAGWWEFDDYRRKTPVSDHERQHIEDTLSTIEAEEREKYDLTYEQLAWRRDTIDSQCDGDPKIFAYYYPSDPVSCWLHSGSPRFDVAKLADMKHRAELITPDRGFLVKQDNGPVVWQSTWDGSGDIQMWEQPKNGMAYLIACDPATGASQTKGADPDATSILVLRGKYHDPDLGRTLPVKVVARVRAPFFEDDDIVGRYVCRLSEFYGRCITVLEVNQGLHVLRVLKDAGIPLYKRVVESAKTKRMEEQYGFKLNDQNQRRMVIDGLAAALRNDEIDIPCPHILHELMKFVRTKTGRYEAAPGEHDDDVMALGMAWEVIPHATIKARRVVRDVDPPDMAKPGTRRAGWRVTNATKTGW
jgi:hypothetical protein